MTHKAFVAASVFLRVHGHSGVSVRVRRGEDSLCILCPAALTPSGGTEDAHPPSSSTPPGMAGSVTAC